MKIGRNDPCPCGSGKKYKNCCINDNSKIISSSDNELTDFASDELYKVGKTFRNETAWIVNPTYSLDNNISCLLLPIKFIESYYFPSFRIVFIDRKQNEYIYINNPICNIKDDVQKIVDLISSVEHTWIESIAIDTVQQIYAVGITISRGRFETDYQYVAEAGKLKKTEILVPVISDIDIYSDNSIKESRVPVVNFSDDEISSIHNYSLSDAISVVSDGQIDNEIELTEKCIAKIEDVYHIQLIGERANLNRAREDLCNASIFECAKFFSVWRKNIIDRFMGKVCTAELSGFYYGMDNCMKNLPVLILPDVHILSTHYESIMQQFPVRENMKYAIPFDDFVIKVSDDNKKTIYVVVHRRKDCYELIGLTATSNDESNALLDYVALYPNNEMLLQYQADFLSRDVCEYDEYSAPCIKVPFNYLNRIHLPNASNQNTSAYKWWNDIAIEYAAGTEDVVEDLITPCSDILILHIWLHTLALYNVMLNVRRIEHKKGNSNEIHSISTGEIKNYANKSFIDLGKNKCIYTYDDNNEREELCRKFHVFSTLRRGHFRRYNSGKIIYIPPTIVTYTEKHLAPDAHEKEYGSFYRNSEDFLREKSYLEADVKEMLDSHDIKYYREVSSSVFPWIGRKRLDFYLPEKQVAIECQGVQHFYPYGKEDKDFEQRKKRDIDKYNECVANNIQLLYFVSPNIPVPEDMSNRYLYITDLDDLFALIS